MRGRATHAPALRPDALAGFRLGAIHMFMYVYRAGLSKVELVAEVHGLLATEREVEQLLCRYLADLADRLRNDMMSAGTDIRI